MKVNLDTVILDIKREPVKNGNDDLTLNEVCCTALLSPYPDEQSLSAKEKVGRFKLAEKIVDGGEQDLSVDDVATLMKLIGKAYPPLTVGRCYEILDPGAK